MEKTKLTVNDTTHTLEADPVMPLIFMLRNRLGLMDKGICR